MEIVFYVDDGYKADLRVAMLLEKYGFKGIFYIPPYKTELSIGEIVGLACKHEIGGHTLNHTRLTTVPKEKAFEEILNGKIELFEIAGAGDRTFAYPRGWVNDEVKELVKLCGYKEARTMKQGCIDLTGTDKFEKPITVHFHPLYFEQWKELFNKAKQINGYFGVTCHGYELDRFQLWEEYEDMLHYIKQNAD